MTEEKKDSGGSQNQGEGDVEAARRYREESQDFAKSGQVEEKAEKARRDLEDDDSDELKQAEQAGKAKAKDFDPQVKRD